MTAPKHNFAFIDAQNVHLGIQSLGWELDWGRFRVYLRDKYKVAEAYLFLGYVPDNQKLYEYLQKSSFILIFKPLVWNKDGTVKGNCDADLVLHTILKINEYDKAIIVTSDGDFYSLVRHLYENGKLLFVLSPYVKTCSKLLRREAKEKIYSMDNLWQKLGREKFRK
ncbi:MAG: NYN domain-containing protein [Candidatus Taylorbacteria bacterium]|nr:NYN domain-containing protein [Candidatus Taylorbacteria bacterium]